jgi:hypothetical protein
VVTVVRLETLSHVVDYRAVDSPRKLFFVRHLRKGEDAADTFNNKDEERPHLNMHWTAPPPYLPRESCKQLPLPLRHIPGATLRGQQRRGQRPPHAADRDDDDSSDDEPSRG